MNEQTQFKFDLLKHEMDTVQNGIRTYGQVQFTIKGWAITLMSGFMIVAVQEKQPILLILPAATALLFWLLDGIFKSIQQIYIDRAVSIESFLRGLNFAEASLQFENETIPNTEAKFSDLKGWKGITRTVDSLIKVQVWVLYIFMPVILGSFYIILRLIDFW